MIGTTVTPPRGGLGWTVWWLALAAASAATGLALRETWLLLLAIPPAALGLTRALWRVPPVSVRLGEQGLDVTGPRRLSIRYGEMLEVWPIGPPVAAGQPLPAAFAIEIVHTRGRLRLPATSPRDLYAFLRGRLPICILSGPLPPALADYRRQHEASFGAERVFAWRTRRGPLVPDRTAALQCALALGVTIVLWLAAAAALPALRAGLIAASLAAAIVGPLGLLVAWSVRRQAASAMTTNAALVVTPVGLALQQGTLAGQIAWQEIQRVEWSGRSFLYAQPADAQQGVRLVVAGAAICIQDVYDRPLQEIHERILAYWR